MSSDLALGTVTGGRATPVVPAQAPQDAGPVTPGVPARYSQVKVELAGRARGYELSNVRVAADVTLLASGGRVSKQTVVVGFVDDGDGDPTPVVLARL